MSRARARVVVFNCLLASLLFGGLTAGWGFVGKPVLEAASVDAILTPEELQDPDLVDLVYRANRHPVWDRWVFSIVLFGAGTAISSAIGLLALSRLPGASGTSDRGAV